MVDLADTLRMHRADTTLRSPRTRVAPAPARLAAALVAGAMGVTGCTYDRTPPTSDGRRPLVYGPEDTDYSNETTNRAATRSLEGLRVDGPRSDIDTAYWDAQLVILGGSEPNGQTALRVFEQFEMRYTDLDRLDGVAALSVLDAFRTWAYRRHLGDEFDLFWSQRGR